MNVKTRLLKLEQMKHSLSIGVFEVLLVNDDVYTYLGSPYEGQELYAEYPHLIDLDNLIIIRVKK